MKAEIKFEEDMTPRERQVARLMVDMADARAEAESIAPAQRGRTWITDQQADIAHAAIQAFIARVKGTYPWTGLGDIKTAELNQFTQGALNDVDRL